jgi:hypothetical protein
MALLFLDDAIESVDGWTFKMTGHEGFDDNKAHVHVHWIDAQSGERQSEAKMEDYQLQLTFEKESDGQLPGEISLVIEDLDTEIAGKFIAVVE